MKIERLIGILAVLLQKEQVTAPYLAEKFEVSRRTINRDVQALCQAGIPIVTAQGKHGGISIMEGYRMDRTLLTSKDMQAILAGLRSLDSVSGTNRYRELMEKLSVGNSLTLSSNNHIQIDLSSWYRSTLAPKIELIQDAIERNRRIIFTYISSRGESERCVEPGYLIFQWASWYVWGYCLSRREFRLFKLNRVSKLACTEDMFEPRPIPEPKLSTEQIFSGELKVKALFEPGARWRLMEEFGPDSFQEQEDGKLLFSFGFSDRENLFGWILSFGAQAELLEPEELRRELHGVLKEACRRYEATDRKLDEN